MSFTATSYDIFFLAIKGYNFANLVTAIRAICQLFQFLTLGAKSYRVKENITGCIYYEETFLCMQRLSLLHSHTRGSDKK